jgi:hypothetical protein
MNSDLTTGSEFLLAKTAQYFADHYHGPAIKYACEVDKGLSYSPSIQFQIHAHLTVLVEISETPYPAILSMRRTDIEDLQVPIAVFCACPEEAYLADQADAKRLITHGFGLITVAHDGQVQVRAHAIPLIQRISDNEFKAELKDLPPAIKRRLVESFDRYIHSPPTGVADVAEVLEGFILKAGKEAAKKGWIDAKFAKGQTPASTLDAMQAASQFGNSMAAIGSVRGYVAEYRNVSHHFPKNKEQAAKKYRECRHAFLDGLKRVNSFRASMKARGLTGNL